MNMVGPHLIVGAHPDDEVLLAGGCLAGLADVFVCILGEGSTCRYPSAERLSSPAIESINDRLMSLESAIQCLGWNLAHAGALPCGNFDKADKIEQVNLVESLIREIQPRTVITHTHRDNHQDHRFVSDVVRIAARFNKFSSLRLLLAGEVISSTTLAYGSEAFSPTFFAGLGKTAFEEKLNALRSYASEIEPSTMLRSMSNIEALARIRGAVVGLPYAEAFEVLQARNA